MKQSPCRSSLVLLRSRAPQWSCQLHCQELSLREVTERQTSAHEMCDAQVITTIPLQNFFFFSQMETGYQLNNNTPNPFPHHLETTILLSI